MELTQATDRPGMGAWARAQAPTANRIAGLSQLFLRAPTIKKGHYIGEQHGPLLVLSMSLEIDNW